MSDMTRAVLSDALRVVVWLLGIGIICWIGYQLVNNRIFMGFDLVAMVTWAVLYFVWRWIRLPITKEIAASRARLAAKGKPLYPRG